ncbi:MAG: CBS domain-containing protein [Methanosarcinales archaeon]
MQVNEIMSDPITIEKSDTISNALYTMEKYNTRRLIVTNEGELYGILTMRNIARQLGTRKKYALPASSIHVTTATTKDFIKILPDTNIKDAITLMKEKQVILIVVENNGVLGWITPHEILKLINNKNLLPDYLCADDAMRSPITANSGDRVVHARRLMLEKDIGRLPILEDGLLVGMVSEKDLAYAMHAFRNIVSGSKQDTRIKNLILADIMKRGVISVITDTPLSDVVNLMLKEDIGSVPVLDLKDELVGIITRRSIISQISF